MSTASEFHDQFQKFTTDVASFMQSLESTQNTLSLDDVLPNITDQQRALNEASSSLPAYDVRRYQNALDDLVKKSEELKKMYAPKQKFSFKSRKDAVVAPAPANHSTERITGKSETALKYDPEALKSPGSITIQGGPASPTHVDVNSHSAIIGSSTVTVLDMLDSTIDLSRQDPYTSVTLRNLKSCVINAAISSTSLFIESCIDCQIQGEAQQFRIHSSSGCTVKYKCRTGRPVIESCSGMKFLNETVNEHGTPMEAIVDDFSDLSGSRRNWQPLPVSQVAR